MTTFEQQLAQPNAIAIQQLERLEKLMATLTESDINLKQNTAQLKSTLDYLLSKENNQS